MTFSGAAVGLIVFSFMRLMPVMRERYFTMSQVHAHIWKPAALSIALLALTLGLGQLWLPAGYLAFGAFVPLWMESRKKLGPSDAERLLQFAELPLTDAEYQILTNTWITFDDPSMNGNSVATGHLVKWQTCRRFVVTGGVDPDWCDLVHENEEDFIQVASRRYKIIQIEPRGMRIDYSHGVAREVGNSPLVAERS
ncbi:MAG: hypothetical protein SFX74_10000 [Fimbriimonadaceae bacterium]|nr:hypothetical protein [Fimbriimonadaceae bacterium]